MKLYRPVGLEELRRTYEENMRSYPQPLKAQRSLDLSLSSADAATIARNRNAGTEPYAGYVTELEIDDEYAAMHPHHPAKDGTERLLRIPIEDFEEFNTHLLGRIKVAAGFFGQQFRGYIPTMFNFAHRDALSQFVMLSYLLDYSTMDFVGEIHANNLAVFLHLPYWSTCNLDRTEVPESRRPRILTAIQQTWSKELPELPPLTPGEI